MSHALVDAKFISFGDIVRIEGKEFIVSSIQGPDSHGAYDLYLLGKVGPPCHKVITELIELELEPDV